MDSTPGGEGKVVWLGGRRKGGKADGVIRPGGGFCEVIIGGSVIDAGIVKNIPGGGRFGGVI